jgi:hypothetical protein
MTRDEVQAVIDKWIETADALRDKAAVAEYPAQGTRISGQRDGLIAAAHQLTEALEKSEPKPEPGQRTLLMSARAAFGWNKACHIDGREIPEMGPGTWIVVEIIRDGMDAELAHVTAYPKVAS